MGLASDQLVGQALVDGLIQNDRSMTSAQRSPRLTAIPTITFQGGIDIGVRKSDGDLWERWKRGEKR